MADDNRTLGRFQLVGIPPAPRGIHQIEVSFDIDANGIMHVKAADKGTGKEQKITITASSGLSKDEIEKMKKEAEAHSTEDKKKREEIDTMNQADSAAYNAEKTLKENADKIDPQSKEKIENAVKDLRKALETKDVNKVKAEMENLQKVVYEMSAELYKKAGPQPGQGEGAYQGAQGEQGPKEESSQEQGQQPGEEKVVDAEYEEVKEDDKK